MIPSEPDPKELARCERVRKRLSRQLGIPLPPREPESAAPPVDVELLKALHRGELTAEAEREVILRIYRFRSWAEAECQLTLDEYRSGKRSGNQP